MPPVLSFPISWSSLNSDTSVEFDAEGAARFECGVDGDIGRIAGFVRENDHRLSVFVVRSEYFGRHVIIRPIDPPTEEG